MPLKPLQIIHEPSILGKDETEMLKGLTALKDQGLGGVVVNVGFENYFEDERKWQEFLDFIRACKKLQMRVWLYDEKGYPSGSAGGRVLRANPDLEAKGLCLDADRLFEDRAFEGTHASDNYHARRRYINLLEKEAAVKFLETTHEVYREKLKDLYWPVEAFFCDESSLIVLNLGKFPHELPVHDAPDPSKKRLPMIAWSKELAGQFNETQARAFFSDRLETKPAKRAYYQAVADLVSRSFFGEIQDWCRKNNTLSSGHLLWEEDLLTHPALYGNALRNILRFDIPGIDVLDGIPETSFKHGARAILLAASAAMLNGTRRIMTETSDFAQFHNKQNLTTVSECRATAAWQAAFGVTDFTWYYMWGDSEILPHPIVNTGDPSFKPRTAEEYRQFNDFVTGLVDQLLPARLVPDVFLYYPVELVQEEFVPSELSYWEMKLSSRLIEVRDAYDRAVDQLVRAGIFPCLVDAPMIHSAVVDAKGVRIMNARARAIVYPEHCPPPRDLQPPAGCPVYEMTADLPQRLFKEGKIRLLNSNPDVLVTVLETEQGKRITCVNLKNHDQTTQVQTADTAETVVLKPYETKVLNK